MGFKLFSSVVMLMLLFTNSSAIARLQLGQRISPFNSPPFCLAIDCHG